MSIPKIHEGEYRFCLIMWEHEPVTAVELAKLCDKELGWKRTTTYTIIKRLGERGVLKNENGTVTSSISKGEYIDLLPQSTPFHMNHPFVFIISEQSTGSILLIGKIVNF